MDPLIVGKYNSQRQKGPKPLLCYAPVTSMYFGHHGKISACCHNRTYILGQYPDSSVAAIWNSEKTEEFRDTIKTNDLPISCYDCRLGLESGNFDAVKAKMYDSLTVNANYPSVLEFELSNTCNLECIMCKGEFSSLIRKNRENKPPLLNPYDSEFVKQIEEFIPHLDEVKFYGGEPFLIDVYYEIWDKILAINPKCRISVQTNATILNDRVKNLLKKGNFHLNISLDSLTKETYEKIRVNADFERTFENLRFFHEYCQEKSTFFGISMCPMQQNWRELPSFINFCNELNSPVYFHTVWSPKDCALMKLSSNELMSVYTFLKGFDFPEGNVIERKNKQHYLDYLKQVHVWCERANKKKQAESLDATLDTNELMCLLDEKIQTHISGMNLNSQTISSTDYLKKMNTIISMLPENVNAAETLARIINEPIEPIIALLQAESEKSLVEKLLSTIND